MKRGSNKQGLLFLPAAKSEVVDEGEEVGRWVSFSEDSSDSVFDGGETTASLPS